jgi:hypothetical protein
MNPAPLACIATPREPNASTAKTNVTTYDALHKEPSANRRLPTLTFTSMALSLCRGAILGLFFTGCMLIGVAGQQTKAAGVTRDSQAITVISQAVNAAGGAEAIRTIHDLTGTGAITYFWGEHEVTGKVTIRTRGNDKLLVRANLPAGDRVWAVNNGHGLSKSTDGRTEAIPYHNTVNVGSLACPVLPLAEALENSSIDISYIGLEEATGHSAHHVRLRARFAPAADPSGLLSKFTARDFWIDSLTFQVIRTLDMVHPRYKSNEDHPHELSYADFHAVNGVSIPFSLTEREDGQRLSGIQLDQVNLNQGLSDKDFEP